MNNVNLMDTVFVPEPQEGDYWQHGFQGTVVEINDDYVVVEDGDGDCWTVEKNKIKEIEE